jgi:hypothetical protein
MLSINRETSRNVRLCKAHLPGSPTTPRAWLLTAVRLAVPKSCVSWRGADDLKLVAAAPFRQLLSLGALDGVKHGSAVSPQWLALVACTLSTASVAGAAK